MYDAEQKMKTLIFDNFFFAILFYTTDTFSQNLWTIFEEDIQWSKDIYARL